VLITGLTQKIEAMASEAGIAYRLAEGYYRDVVQNEVVLANITKDDHILCIGGGICPFSAILFHQITGARVTVIDNDSNCVPKARQVIKRLGLGEYVRVLYQDGGSAGINFSDYTVVHFALQVCPMECVFTYVENNVSPGTKLLVRRPKSRLGKLYSRLSRELLSHCPLTTHKKARNIDSTALYIKQERHDGKKGVKKATVEKMAVCYTGDTTVFYGAAV